MAEQSKTRNSCLYRGIVSHRRRLPAHRFSYKSAWIYLDLDEVNELDRQSWILSRRRLAPMSFRRKDHFGDQDKSLRCCVQELVLSKSGIVLTGTIRVLTQLSNFGFFFSPLSVFYCFDAEEKLQAVVAEVNNTPWGETHCYVLWSGNRESPARPCHYSHAKEFHVSPFLDMHSTYRWKITQPNDELRLSLGCEQSGTNTFQAHLVLNRHELSEKALAATLFRRPLAGIGILVSIYFQALRLWMKRCQFFPHPQVQSESSRLEKREDQSRKRKTA